MYGSQRASEMFNRLDMEASNKKLSQSRMIRNPVSMNIRLLVSTFNLGNHPIDHVEYLIPEKGRNLDILVLGFQESLYDLNKLERTPSTADDKSSLLAGGGGIGDYFDM
jgi:hypothetical protein